MFNLTLETAKVVDIDDPKKEGKIQINETVRDKEIYIVADIGNYNVTYDLYGKENKRCRVSHDVLFRQARR